MSAVGGQGNPKLDWIQTVANGEPVGYREQIEEYAQRVARLVRRRGGRFGVFEAESRFVTGLGSSHPVENGFAWHPTLGTPFLPGSSVKGLVRAWARAEAEPRSDADTVHRLFGPSGSSELAPGVGTMCFLDAIPLADVRLEADVMTPHYANWNRDDTPGDWRSPTPIPFLATAAKTRFLFGVVPRSNAAKRYLESVFAWLNSALEWSGAGAKTAVGYGRFRRDREATLALEIRLDDEEREDREKRQRREALKSPEGRWRLKLDGLSETQVLEEVRVRLEKEPIADPMERKAFADAVWGTGWPRHWLKGGAATRTTVGKKKLKQRARLVRAARADSD